MSALCGYVTALLLYMLLECHTTGAIISIILLSIGLAFCIFVVTHSSYCWQVEKNQANLNIPPFEQQARPQPEPATHSELSTLVWEPGGGGVL